MLLCSFLRILLVLRRVDTVGIFIFVGVNTMLYFDSVTEGTGLNPKDTFLNVMAHMILLIQVSINSFCLCET